MKKIALTVSYEAPPTDEKDLWRLECYFNAIRQGGATPTALYLDEWEARVGDVINEFDGVILAGGADLPTDWYGETPLEGAGLDIVSPRRPEFEKRVVSDFWSAGKPVFGICYGAQFLNVLRSGTLYQDIELQQKNRPNAQIHTDGNQHLVVVDRNSQLFQIVGEERFAVPSYHHQAICEAAPGALISSFALDGVAESVEWHERNFFLGVQWHPERAPESNATQKLFAAFVAACR